MGLGSIGIGGLILILVVVLLLFGPSKLPELGRAFGRTLSEFKKGAKDVMDNAEAANRESNREEANGPEFNAAPDNLSTGTNNRRLPD